MLIYYSIINNLSHITHLYQIYFDIYLIYLCTADLKKYLMSEKINKILYLQIFSTKLGGHCKLLPTSPFLSFAMLSQHRRMMRYLFWNCPPSKVICTITLKSFTQKRIERLSRSSSSCRVTRYSERSYISHLFIAICTFRSPI